MRIFFDVDDTIVACYDFAPDFCVDNHAGVVEAFGGLVVPSYRSRLPDDEMLRVYEEIRRMTVGAHPGQ